MMITIERVAAALLGLCFGALFVQAGFELEACAGPHSTTVDLSANVKVDPSHCTESPDASLLSNENVFLDCTTIGAGGTIHITFPRKAWWSIKLTELGPDAETTPGK